jgi:hypothetical protein
MTEPFHRPPYTNDHQVPMLIFLGILVVLGLLALWGWWHGAWDEIPSERAGAMVGHGQRADGAQRTFGILGKGGG